MTRLLVGALLALAFADAASAKVHFRALRHDMAAARSAPVRFHGVNPGPRENAGWRRTGWGAMHG